MVLTAERPLSASLRSANAEARVLKRRARFKFFCLLFDLVGLLPVLAPMFKPTWQIVMRRGMGLKIWCIDLSKMQRSWH